MRLARQMSPISKSTAVHQLPKEVGRMCVGVPSFSRPETRIQADHQEHETWSDAVDEIADGRVRVGGAQGFAGGASFG